MLDSDWLPNRQCIKIWSREPRVLPRRVGNVLRYGAESREPRVLPRRVGNVLRYGAESRKPTQCIKIACIKIWSRVNVLR